jgi:hypothetical protein
MFNTTTKNLSIAPPTICHFRWGLDSNPWVSLMLPYLLQPRRKNIPMFSMRSTNPPNSFSRFNIFGNRSMRFFQKTMLSTSNAMINIGYHTSFRWETRSGYIFRKRSLQGPIRSSSHFDMGLTLSPYLWVAMSLRSTLHLSLACTQYSMCTSFDHIFHHH